MVIESTPLTKGQVHTLEAVAAAVIILSSVVFAQSVTSITPMTASTSSQHVENQHGELATGFLSITSTNGALKKALLYWDNTNQRFHNSTGETVYYTMITPDNDFGNALEDHFIENGIGVRVDIAYYRENASGELVQVGVPYIDFGTPSDHAYTASTNITLYDSDKLIQTDGSESSIQLDDSTSTYFIDDIDDDSELYNIVEVRVNVWRI